MLRSILSPSTKAKERSSQKIGIILEYDESTFENDSFLNTNLEGLQSEPPGEEVLREKIRNFLQDINNVKKPAQKCSTTNLTPKKRSTKVASKSVLTSTKKTVTTSSKSDLHRLFSFRHTFTNLKGLNNSHSKVQIRAFDTSMVSEQRAKTPILRASNHVAKKSISLKTPEKSNSVPFLLTSIQKKVTPLGPKLKTWEINRSKTPSCRKLN
eukprot:TRINITY_DN1459_c0_g2_i3.p1 TRINITY_DN1459_c0_g2~~TRINITY_DN1459_c0_g2_i3.p1  ORF type:complete len:211 (-),score=27.71 TRINITY_DN1459_c0_g2_i3:147-779(-)